MTTSTTTQRPLGLTITEFCREARISERSYFRLAARGEAPPTVRIGRRRVVLFDTARQWLLSREA